MTSSKNRYVYQTYSLIHITLLQLFSGFWKSGFTYSGFFIKHSTEDAVLQLKGLWIAVKERNLTLWECFCCKYFISVMFLFSLCCEVLTFLVRMNAFFCCFFFSDSLLSGHFFPPPPVCRKLPLLILHHFSPPSNNPISAL